MLGLVACNRQGSGAVRETLPLLNKLYVNKYSKRGSELTAVPLQPFIMLIPYFSVSHTFFVRNYMDHKQFSYSSFLVDSKAHFLYEIQEAKIKAAPIQNNIGSKDIPFDQE